MRRTLNLVLATMLLLLVAPAASASHSLEATVARSAFLLSPSTVHVSGTLTCVGAPASGQIGVVLIQPPGDIALDGGGTTRFSCSGGERVSWGVDVIANEQWAFTIGTARFDAFAHTDCSDEQVDCPSVSVDGLLQIEGAPTCFGASATLIGHGGDERIQGTSGNDVIVGRGGRDIVFAGGGDDLVCGNEGSDVMDGGGGHDRMSGAAGEDFITGVGGNDEIRGGIDSDVLNFGDHEDGNDLVSGGGGNDDLHAGVGLDRLLGNDGNDTLREGEVDAPMIDLFSGGAGTDACSPGAEDVVRGCENGEPPRRAS